ncbi:hypothetical protein J2755_001388 [Methanohalophilus levihalophilus]|uniref:hypothetical protein n=1 Tax=Methanohalophilus levihalophilus TaxID=1431282 RepID=UPI001AE7C1D1|nr:hypothetical protein [Methanohalophilus levihalophilus]MBP2030454.1 hypothetical protein [Methanohalophilus levihalophilus]
MPEENKNLQKPEQRKEFNIVGENGLLKSRELPHFEGIHYEPHKTSGLQSASDMWIDKERMYEGLQVKEPIADLVKKAKILK